MTSEKFGEVDRWRNDGRGPGMLLDENGPFVWIGDHERIIELTDERFEMAMANLSLAEAALAKIEGIGGPSQKIAKEALEILYAK